MAWASGQPSRSQPSQPQTPRSQLQHPTRPRAQPVSRTRLQHRWNQVGRSPYPWEQEGLDHIRNLMPDAEPFRAWATFSFTARSGRINECDLLVAVPAGLYLLELKGHPGRVVNHGETWTFTQSGGGRVLSLRNPLHLTDAKAKDLRSRLDWAASQLGLRLNIPRIQPAVFLSASGLDSHLDEVQRTNVYARDGASRGLPTVWKDLLSRPPERDALRVTPDVSRKLGGLLATIGVAASNAHLRFGDDWVMRPEVLDAGPTWEDRLAERKGLVEEQGRVRIYLTALQAAEDERRSVERAARREYQVLQGISHPGIAQALDLRIHQGGPAILFRHGVSDLRLDSCLELHVGRLTPATRLDLVRQLAEAVRYAHARSLYHRALAARSVYVSAREDGSSPVLRIIDWQSAARDADATMTSSISMSTLPGRHTGDAEAYLAPESNQPYADPADPADLDVFGLGAVSYLILTGSPPALGRPALNTRLSSEGGLHLFAASDSASAELDDLVFSATRADVTDRLESAEAFLLFLDAPEKQVGEAQLPASGVDPLTVLPGDELPGGWEVTRVLGTGSTARALLIERLEERGEAVEHSLRVLKVALDGVKAQHLQAESDALIKVGGGCVIRRIDGPRIIGDRTVLDLEYAGEQSLGTRLRAEGRLSYHDLERFGGDLFSALKELAAHGVRHRDIKPDNLGIQTRSDRSRQLKLFDFSLTAVPDRDVTAGTRGYLDPFIGSDRRPAYDDHAEWYATAATLYEMATGTRLDWDFGAVAPLMSDVQLPQIAADLFEPALREGLIGFFARALHREVDQRFDTLERLESAWRAVFTTADAALPASTSSAGTSLAGTSLVEGLETVADAVDPVAVGTVAVDPAREEHAAVATLTTPLDAAGLSPRAVSVARGLGATTVADLLDVPLSSITRARGTGNRVRKELIRRHRQWGAALTRPAAGTPPGPPPGRLSAPGRPSSPGPARSDVPDLEVRADWLPSVDELVTLLTAPFTGRRSRRSDVVHAMLGLAPGAGSWPTQADVADAVGLTQTSVSRHYKEALVAWAARPELAAVRDELVTLLDDGGRLSTTVELARALRARRGCTAAIAEQELALAGAVVRAAVDVEQRPELPGRVPSADAEEVTQSQGEADARLAAVRRGATVWVVAESLPGTNDPVPAELVEYVVKLGAEASRLAGEDPLPGRSAVLRTLRGVTLPEGLAPLPEPRLVELGAAAAPVPVCVSSLLELYPGDLALDRALRISQAPAGVTHARGVTMEDLLARVRVRFPDLQIAPSLTYVTVEQALKNAGFDLPYDTARGAFYPRERPAAPSSVTASSSVTVTTFGQGDTPARLLPQDGVPALSKLAAGVERGGFMALTVKGRRLRGTVVDDLAGRYPVARFDLDAVFLHELRALVAERGQDWSKVLAGDLRLEESGQAGRGFASYLQTTWRRVLDRAHEAYRPGQVLFVHDAALLGRYWDDGGHDLLTALQASARRAHEGPHGLWLLCPGDTERETPRVGRHIVEVLGDHEVAALDRVTVDRLAGRAA